MVTFPRFGTFSQFRPQRESPHTNTKNRGTARRAAISAGNNFCETNGAQCMHGCEKARVVKLCVFGVLCGFHAFYVWRTFHAFARFLTEPPLVPQKPRIRRLNTSYTPLNVKSLNEASGGVVFPGLWRQNCAAGEIPLERPMRIPYQPASAFPIISLVCRTVWDFPAFGSATRGYMERPSGARQRPPTAREPICAGNRRRNQL